MLNTNIEVNFQINNESIPYGENRLVKTIEEYENFIEKEVKIILGGLYPEYENLKINVTTNFLT